MWRADYGDILPLLVKQKRARKVGLKELWTLKWNKSYNIAGSWTKAGGCQPDNWPDWMRSFKDY